MLGGGAVRCLAEGRGFESRSRLIPALSCAGLSRLRDGEREFSPSRGCSGDRGNETDPGPPFPAPPRKKGERKRKKKNTVYFTPLHQVHQSPCPGPNIPPPAATVPHRSPGEMGGEPPNPPGPGGGGTRGSGAASVMGFTPKKPSQGTGEPGGAPKHPQRCPQGGGGVPWRNPSEIKAGVK